MLIFISQNILFLSQDAHFRLICSDPRTMPSGVDHLVPKQQKSIMTGNHTAQCPSSKLQIALGYAESFKMAKSEAQRAQDVRNSRIIKSDSEAKRDKDVYFRIVFNYVVDIFYHFTENDPRAIIKLSNIQNCSQRPSQLDQTPAENQNQMSLSSQTKKHLQRLSIGHSLRLENCFLVSGCCQDLKTSKYSLFIFHF